MKKITFLLMSMLLSVTVHLQAQCPHATLISSEKFVCTDGVITLADTTRMAANGYDFDWHIPANSEIVSGFGGPAIGIKFRTPGSKFVSVSYRISDECTVKGEIEVIVKSTPSMSGISLKNNADGIFCENSQIVPTNYAPAFVDVDGIYNQPTWTLNGSPFDIKKNVINRFDDGKLLRYEATSKISSCNSAQSNAIKLQVNDNVLIKNLAVNGDNENVPVGLVAGDALNLSFDAISAKSKITSYKWSVGSDSVLKTETFDPGVSSLSKTTTYTAKSADYGKSLKLSVTNACGTVTAERVIMPNIQNLMTVQNTSLQSVFETPSDFMIRKTNNFGDKTNLPEKYWENQKYVFYTSNNAKYTDGGFAWFNRTSANDQWVESVPGVGYKFNVVIMKTKPMMFTGTANMTPPYPGSTAFVKAPGFGIMKEANTTILMDEGEYYHVMASDMMGEFEVMDASGSWVQLPAGTDGGYNLFNELAIFGDPTDAANMLTFGAVSNCKIFGLRNVTIKYYTDGDIQKLDMDLGTVHMRNGMATMDVSKYTLLNAPENGVLENVSLDGSGLNFFNHAVYANGISGTLCKNMIVKDVTLKNMVQDTYTLGAMASPKGILTVASNQNQNQSSTQVKKYFQNITIDASCSLQPNGVPFSFINANQADNCYFKDIKVNAPITGPNQYSISFGRATGVANHNNTVDGMTMADEDGFIYFQRYDNKNMAVSEDFRYMRVTPDRSNTALLTNASSYLTLHKTLPANTADAIVYDRKDGYWIVQSGIANLSIAKQITVLRDFYAQYNVNNYGAPLPNIKIIASNGEISGFQIPDLKLAKQEPINVVLVPDVNTVITQAPGTAEYINYVTVTGIDSIITFVADDASLVNLYNINFAAAGLSSTDVLQKLDNVKLGNLYNCKVTDYSQGAFITINGDRTGIEDVTASKVAVIYPNPVDAELSVNSSEAILSVKITDINGRTVYSQKYNTNAVTISVESLNSGVYFVSVETAAKVEIQKIVKK